MQYTWSNKKYADQSYKLQGIQLAAYSDSYYLVEHKVFNLIKWWWNWIKYYWWNCFTSATNPRLKLYKNFQTQMGWKKGSGPITPVRLTSLVQCFEEMWNLSDCLTSDTPRIPKVPTFHVASQMSTLREQSMNAISSTWEFTYNMLERFTCKHNNFKCSLSELWGEPICKKFVYLKSMNSTKINKLRQ